MIEPEKILEELEFWKAVRDRTLELELQDDGVMDEAIKAMCQVFHNALFGNNGLKKTDEQWHAHLVLAQKAYDRLKELPCCEIDAGLFYKARSVLWATAIVAGIDPHEAVDGKEEPMEEIPADDITDVITEIV